MRICHIADELSVGGLERNLEEIVLGLREYSHEVWCLKKKGALAREVEAAGVPVREFGLERASFIGAVRKLARAMRESGFDVVHCHGLYPSIWGRVAALLAGVPVRIAHAQSLYYWLYLRDRIKLNILAKYTTRIIAVSEAVKKSLVEYLRIDARKITVVYNASPDMKAMRRRSRNDVRRDLGFGPDDFVVGVVGRLQAHKGHEFLLHAIQLCKDRGHDCKCLIVGDGPFAPALRSVINGHKMSDRAVLSGETDRIPDMLAAMDVFALPSVLKEGMPLVLAEAASAGLPLIATDIGGNPEIVSDAVSGFIVTPQSADALAEKMIRLKLDADLRASMGASSRDIWQKRFTLTGMLEKIKKVYEESKRNSP